MDMKTKLAGLMAQCLTDTWPDAQGLLTAEELEKLTAGLKEIAAEIEAGRFEIEPGTEDVHSQVELMLTRRLGDAGKKIHSGRSRNDQVLVDLKLFLRGRWPTP